MDMSANTKDLLRFAFRCVEFICKTLKTGCLYLSCVVWHGISFNETKLNNGLIPE